MADQEFGESLLGAAGGQAKRLVKKKLWAWILAGGAPILGWGFLILAAVIASMMLLAGIGQWFSGLFGPNPPVIASEMSRPAEWMSVIIQNSVQDGVPNVIAMAVINAASDGQAYGDRYYCSNGQSAGEKCSVAFPPKK